MTGFPYFYGDTDKHKLDLTKYGEPTLKIASMMLLLGSPALAAEPATEVAANIKEVSNASFALTCAVCAAAGGVCKTAVEKATSKNPKLIVPFGCVALMSWCAAKASPL